MCKTCFFLLISFGLTACYDEPRTEAWFQAHPWETYGYYKACLESGSVSSNCETARLVAVGFAHVGITHTNIRAEFAMLFSQKKNKRG